MSSVCEQWARMHIPFVCVAFGVHSFRNYFFLSLSSQALVRLLVRSFVAPFIFLCSLFFSSHFSHFLAYGSFWYGRVCVPISYRMQCARCARMCWETWLLLCWLQTGCGFLINRQWKMEKEEIFCLWTWFCSADISIAPLNGCTATTQNPIDRTVGWSRCSLAHSWHISFDISLFPFFFRFVWPICQFGRWFIVFVSAARWHGGSSTFPQFIA